MEDKQVLVRYKKTVEEQHQDQQAFDNKMAAMPERDRRKLQRRIDDGENVLEEVLAMDEQQEEEEEPKPEVELSAEDAMAAAMEAMDEEDEFDLDDEDADEV